MEEPNSPEQELERILSVLRKQPLTAREEEALGEAEKYLKSLETIIHITRSRFIHSLSGYSAVLATAGLTYEIYRNGVNANRLIVFSEVLILGIITSGIVLYFKNRYQSLCTLSQCAKNGKLEMLLDDRELVALDANDEHAANILTWLRQKFNLPEPEYMFDDKSDDLEQ